MIKTNLSDHAIYNGYVILRGDRRITIAELLAICEVTQEDFIIAIDNIRSSNILTAAGFNASDNPDELEINP
jgi:hypothetical protein